jgi:hypothetical protein
LFQKHHANKNAQGKNHKNKSKKKEREINQRCRTFLYIVTHNIYFTFAVKFLTRRSWSLSLGGRPYPLVIKKKERNSQDTCAKKFHQMNRHNC